jgi:voltage-gated potassium channel
VSFDPRHDTFADRSDDGGKPLKQRTFGAPMISLLAALIGKLKRNQVLLLATLAVVATLLGAWLFSLTQKVSLGTALYWAITTATTVGYGDVVPKPGIGRVIAVGVMLTAIPLVGAVFAALAGMTASLHIRRLLGMEQRQWRGHTLILGYSAVVPYLLESLRPSGRALVVVANMDRALVPDGVSLVSSDPANESVLRSVNPDQAREAFIAGVSDSDALLIAIHLRHLAPQLSPIVMVQSPKVAEALHDLGIRYTVAADQLVGRTVAKSLQTPHATDLIFKLLEDDEVRLIEIPVPQAWVGKPLSHVRAQYDGLILGLVTPQRMTMGLSQDPEVSAYDYLLVLEKSGR